MSNPAPNGDIASLEREVHELRQQLIRKEAEINRREALLGTKVKLEKELGEVNKNIKSVSNDIEDLQTKVKELQSRLQTAAQAAQHPVIIIEEAPPDESKAALDPNEGKSSREQSFEKLIEKTARAKKSALRIALKLLGQEFRELLRRCHEDDPDADLLDIATYLLNHPSLLSSQSTYSVMEPSIRLPTSPSKNNLRTPPKHGGSMTYSKPLHS